MLARYKTPSLPQSQYLSDTTRRSNLNTKALSAKTVNMYAINNFVQGLLLVAALLVSFNAVSALPATEARSIEARNSLHDCSVFVQRWCNDCESRFDTA